MKKDDLADILNELAYKSSSQFNNLGGLGDDDDDPGDGSGDVYDDDYDDDSDDYEINCVEIRRGCVQDAIAEHGNVSARNQEYNDCIEDSEAECDEMPDGLCDMVQSRCECEKDKRRKICAYRNSIDLCMANAGCNEDYEPDDCDAYAEQARGACSDVDDACGQSGSESRKCIKLRKYQIKCTKRKYEQFKNSYAACMVHAEKKVDGDGNKRSRNEINCSKCDCSKAYADKAKNLEGKNCADTRHAGCPAGSVDKRNIEFRKCMDKIQNPDWQLPGGGPEGWYDKCLKDPSKCSPPERPSKWSTGTAGCKKCVSGQNPGGTRPDQRPERPDPGSGRRDRPVRPRGGLGV